jgi:hypothetical protein
MEHEHDLKNTRLMFEASLVLAYVSFVNDMCFHLTSGGTFMIKFRSDTG